MSSAKPVTNASHGEESPGDAPEPAIPCYGFGDTTWFTRDRLGMFIHWGTYALPARHEWVRQREEIPWERYKRYFDHFDPDLYDPADWARQAKAAGMKYFVITAKHHEGFCLWDTAYTDYKATNTPYGKDLLRPMVEAFRAEGLRVGFYYSLLDWHHPDYPIDRLHVHRNSEEMRRTNAKRDVHRYAEYMRNQIRELLTDFGQVDYLFFDFSFPGEDGKGHDDWQSEELLRTIRELQPNVIVNDRLDLPAEMGVDLVTPEQYMREDWPTDDKGQRICWETCQTLSGSWGYFRDEYTWKSTKQLLFLLVDTVSKGGNLLLNVGPTARGDFDDRARRSLADLGRWMARHGRSIYGCTQADGFTPPRDSRLTYNPETNRLYIHLLNWPINEMVMHGLADRFRYAQLLHDASEVPTVVGDGTAIHHALRVKVSDGGVKFKLPIRQPECIDVPVIEVFLKD